MTANVHVHRIDAGWDVRLDRRSVAIYVHESCALEAAWDLAKRLGTWFVMSGDPGASCCSVRVVQGTLTGRTPATSPAVRPPTP